MTSSVLQFAAGFAFASLICFVFGVLALKRRRFLLVGVFLMFAVVALSVAGLCFTISVATRGYRAFTREEVAAVVETRPTGPQRFDAAFTFPDGRTATYGLTGDELYVDAHILKWKPLANLLGLHTAYELDRVTGRYTELEDEQTLPRSVFSLAEEKPVDMFNLRRRLLLFRPLVDAEYGSATFILANRPATYELRVSISGLLIRQSTPSGTAESVEPVPGN
jgi:hypothetical protein